MSKSALEIRQAGRDDIDRVAPLFDAYRRFYRQASELERAREFLLERMENGQSVIFLALDGNRSIGFTQLYPSFSSVAMAPILILNDLFVAPEARRRGVASALLRKAAEYGQSVGAVRLALSTELTNTVAQATYEALGWQRDATFCTYQLALKSSAQDG